jgi:hypothetical protein
MVGSRTKRFSHLDEKQKGKLMESANVHLHEKYKKIKVAHAKVCVRESPLPPPAMSINKILIHKKGEALVFFFICLFVLLSCFLVVL